MGEVVVARSPRADAPIVALKILDEASSQLDSAVAMFMDEASIMAQLQHPNVLRVFDFGQDQGRYFLAMEYLQGQSLAQLVVRAHEQRGGIDKGVLIVIGARAARGLSAAHVATGADGAPLGVVHRDVSPQNIFITYSGMTKMIDFGIARASRRLTRTTAGVFKGKASYMSPEQITERPIDGKSDVFALGICLWEMVAGQRLFLRRDQFETMQAVVEATIAPPSQIVGKRDDRLDGIILSALERRVPDRPDAGELAAQLMAYAHDVKPPADDSTVARFVQTLFAAEMTKDQSLLREIAEQRLSDATRQRLERTATDSGGGTDDITLAGNPADLEAMNQLGKHRSPSATNDARPPEAPAFDLYSTPPEERGGAVHKAVEVLSSRLAPLEARQQQEREILSGARPLPSRPAGPPLPIMIGAALILMVVLSLVLLWC
jgi:serine/threonine-protein kinase